MASCTQIESLIQAYIDGELGQSERVIFDQHVCDCPACAALYKRHQRSSAWLFEAFADDRLSHSLARKVLENLPEVEHIPANVEEINWRAKHPASQMGRLARFVPVAVLLLLVALGFVIREYWPVQLPVAEAIGVVTHSTGEVTKYSKNTGAGRDCAAQQYILKGENYETGPASTAILSIVGPTEIKLNANTRLHVLSDRRLTVDYGEVLLDIGGEGNPFKIFTPQGEITVFGTAFNVVVDTEKTTVTVERGHVTAENGADIQSLAPGEQLDLTGKDGVSAVRNADVTSVTKWAEKIIPDEKAALAFESFQLNRSAHTELTAKAVFVFNTLRGDGTAMKVRSISLFWEPNTVLTGHCGYTMYVFDDSMQVLFREHIAGKVFSDKNRRSVDIPVPGDPITGVKRLSVRLVPDYSSGDSETVFEEPKATAF